MHLCCHKLPGYVLELEGQCKSNTNKMKFSYCNVYQAHNDKYPESKFKSIEVFDHNSYRPFG